LYNFIVLCETNILSLINQCLDNYYQIKIKLLQYCTHNATQCIREVPESDINKALLYYHNNCTDMKITLATTVNSLECLVGEGNAFVMLEVADKFKQN
jgi:hypothetical protein